MTLVSGTAYGLWSIWRETGGLDYARAFYVLLFYAILSLPAAAVVTGAATLLMQALRVEQPLGRAGVAALVAAVAMLWAFPPRGTPVFGIGLSATALGVYLAARGELSTAAGVRSYLQMAVAVVAFAHLTTLLYMNEYSCTLRSACSSFRAQRLVLLAVKTPFQYLSTCWRLCILNGSKRW